ncbi:MAG: hypothetical protein L3J72_04800 [Thermoplasmata archaeon]|nr:hypothetical protein [Thermoplasmata archaeon]
MFRWSAKAISVSGCVVCRVSAIVKSPSPMFDRSSRQEGPASAGPASGLPASVIVEPLLLEVEELLLELEELLELEDVLLEELEELEEELLEDEEVEDDALEEPPVPVDAAELEDELDAELLAEEALLEDEGEPLPELPPLVAALLIPEWEPPLADVAVLDEVLPVALLEEVPELFSDPEQATRPSASRAVNENRTMGMNGASGGIVLFPQPA